MARSDKKSASADGATSLDRRGRPGLAVTALQSEGSDDVVDRLDRTSLRRRAKTDKIDGETLVRRFWPTRRTAGVCMIKVLLRGGGQPRSARAQVRRSEMHVTLRGFYSARHIRIRAAARDRHERLEELQTAMASLRALKAQSTRARSARTAAQQTSVEASGTRCWSRAPRGAASMLLKRGGQTPRTSEGLRHRHDADAQRGADTAERSATRTGAKRNARETDSRAGCATPGATHER